VCGEDGARGDLADGDGVEELGVGDPPEALDEVAFEEGEKDVAAAVQDGADLQEGQEELGELAAGGVGEVRGGERGQERGEAAGGARWAPVRIVVVRVGAAAVSVRTAAVPVGAVFAGRVRVVMARAGLPALAGVPITPARVTVVRGGTAAVAVRMAAVLVGAGVFLAGVSGGLVRVTVACACLAPVAAGGPGARAACAVTRGCVLVAVILAGAGIGRPARPATPASEAGAGTAAEPAGEPGGAGADGGDEEAAGGEYGQLVHAEQVGGEARRGGHAGHAVFHSGPQEAGDRPDDDGHDHGLDGVEQAGHGWGGAVADVRPGEGGDDREGR